MNFTQPVSMVCTEEQYRAFLREPLLKMGYQEKSISYWASEYSLLVTNLCDIPGEIGNIKLTLTRDHNRYYIETFNPDLFLALAAMTSEPYGIPGEYWTYIGEKSGQNFLNGRVYRSRARVSDSLFIIDGLEKKNGFSGYNLEKFRKSALDELVSQLTVKSIKEKNMAQKSFKTTRQNLHKVWEIACSNWQSKIERLVEEFGNLFSDEVELPFEEVEEMFEAATNTQELVLRQVFPTYSRSKNAWIGDVSDDEMSEISEKIFGDGGFLELTRYAADSIGRPDLRERALYVSNLLEVKVHKISSGGHVIEFIRK